MQDQRDLRARLESALAEGQRLREETRQLKALLTQHSIPLPEVRALQSPTERCLPAPSDISQVGTLSDNPAKVALFRSLFRGREDVYAERWRMKDGTWAYRPAGKKDWQAVLASRPEHHKKVDRETRTLYAVTDEVIRQHLRGKKTIGIYPLLVDETCWLLAVDFDKAAWQEDSLAFLATCKRAGIPAYLERSRSGNGAHVWIFFEVPISAVLARKMGCALLTQTMENRHHLGLDSYDRFSQPGHFAQGGLRKPNRASPSVDAQAKWQLLVYRRRPSPVPRPMAIFTLNPASRGRSSGMDRQRRDTPGSGHGRQVLDDR
jgi:hypothetical protein